MRWCVPKLRCIALVLYIKLSSSIIDSVGAFQVEIHSVGEFTVEKQSVDVVCEIVFQYIKLLY